MLADDDPEMKFKVAYSLYGSTIDAEYDPEAYPDPVYSSVI